MDRRNGGGDDARLDRRSSYAAAKLVGICATPHWAPRDFRDVRWTTIASGRTAQGKSTAYPTGGAFTSLRKPVPGRGGNRTSRPGTAYVAEVDHQIAELVDQSTHELRLAWRQLYCTGPPLGLSRDLLIRALANQLQERTHGGASRALRRRLQSLAGASDNGTMAVDPGLVLKAGTTLVRHALLAALGLANLFIALRFDIAIWAWFISVGSVGTKLAAFARLYAGPVAAVRCVQQLLL